MIEPASDTVSITKQCSLLTLNRSSWYYKKKPMSAFNLQIMNRIDEIYCKNPEYGVRIVTKVLRREGLLVNKKRIRRLMHIMGIRAIYPKKDLSIPDSGHKKYPYLLRDLVLSRVNQVWSTDITYIRMKGSYVYLTAVIDWYSRKILSYRLSVTMDTQFCVDALEEALMKYGEPEYFNTDQGSQFTSNEYLGVLEEHKNIRISMDGKGRALDNVYIERFWRTLKYGEVYINEYQSVADAKIGIWNYITKYNTTRPHSAHGEMTPDEVYFNMKAAS